MKNASIMQIAVALGVGIGIGMLFTGGKLPWNDDQSGSPPLEMDRFQRWRDLSFYS
jgi:hypothetical protein